MVMIVNKDAKNEFGEERGYRIMPSRGPAGFHMTIQNSTNMQKTAGFGTHAYYLTKHVSSPLRKGHHIQLRHFCITEVVSLRSGYAR